MNHSDKQSFKDLFESVYRYYGKGEPTTMDLKMDFTLLAEYEFSVIERAVFAHMKSGKFMPRAADIEEQIHGKAITADQVVAAAKLAQTPFGIMARMHIGTGNLNDLNSYELKQIADEVLQLLPKWKEQAAAGSYRKGQISIMIKHGVDPLAPFHQGMAGPTNQTALSARIKSISCTKRHQELLEPPHRDQSTHQKRSLEQTMAKLENDNG